jgi:hypothetical protein
MALQQDCEAMNAEGKIQDLMKDLNANADALAKIRLDRHADQDADRIHDIQQKIHDITTHAKNILRPDWTDSRWPYKAGWDIRFTDVMSIDPAIIQTNFAFDAFELTGLTIGGMEREDLYPLVNVTASPQSLHIEIEKKASSLELCQLQSTLAISGTVKFKYKNKEYSRDSDLILRPGAIHVPEPVSAPVAPPFPTLPAFPEAPPEWPQSPKPCQPFPKCMLGGGHSFPPTPIDPYEGPIK